MYRYFCIVFIFLIVLAGCSTSRYIHDPDSRERQAELKKQRSGNIVADVGILVASVILTATVDASIQVPEGHEFRKLKINNTTRDTLYINMLTDVYWDEDNYCDFLDIRIPPHDDMKVLVPVDAVYNLYFSNTPESEDDEFIEINTNDFKKISPYPGMFSKDELEDEPEGEEMPESDND